MEDRKEMVLSLPEITTALHLVPIMAAPLGTVQADLQRVLLTLSKVVPQPGVTTELQLVPIMVAPLRQVQAVLQTVTMALHLASIRVARLGPVQAVLQTVLLTLSKGIPQPLVQEVQPAMAPSLSRLAAPKEALTSKAARQQETLQANRIRHQEMRRMANPIPEKLPMEACQTWAPLLQEILPCTRHQRRMATPALVELPMEACQIWGPLPQETLPSRQRRTHHQRHCRGRFRPRRRTLHIHRVAAQVQVEAVQRLVHLRQPLRQHPNLLAIQELLSLFRFYLAVC
jgi:hypothetical protein